jgi:regulator of RNase E activity RraB
VQLTELLHSKLEQLMDVLEVFMVVYEIWGSYSSISAREGNQIIRYLCIGFESWELNKDIAKQLRTFEREFYEECLWELK